VRRATLITIIVLFVLIGGTAIYQLTIASRDVAPLDGPVSPGQLPSPPASVSVSVSVSAS
jgi:hypothetical protein